MYLIIDVDGVITDGKMIYSKDGKEYKSFGPDDVDALHWLKEQVPDIEIFFVSADNRGFEISKKRVDDMGFKIEFIQSKERWLRLQNMGINLNDSIYIGDGFFDYDNFKHFKYSIAPMNSFIRTRLAADYVTSHNGGDRCVAEACLHIYERFYKND